MRELAIRFKGCPRCGGDLFPEHEMSGWNLSCLQCGHILWLESVVGREDGSGEDAPSVAVSTLEREKIAA